MNRSRAESSSVQPSHRLSPPFIQSISIYWGMLSGFHLWRESEPSRTRIHRCQNEQRSRGQGTMHLPLLDWCDVVLWPQHWYAGVGRERGIASEGLKGPMSGTLVPSMICECFPSSSFQRKPELHIPVQHQKPSSHSNSSFSPSHSCLPTTQSSSLPGSLCITFTRHNLSKRPYWYSIL